MNNEHDQVVTTEEVSSNGQVPATNASIPPYPFVAIVGQAELKLALLLCVVNPTIGGVMVMGHRGTAKSTSVRALSRNAAADQGSGRLPVFVCARSAGRSVRSVPGDPRSEG
nr:hypothetical protein [Chloroflexus sp.]